VFVEKEGCTGLCCGVIDGSDGRCEEFERLGRRMNERKQSSRTGRLIAVRLRPRLQREWVCPAADSYGLKVLRGPCEVRLVTDSQYLAGIHSQRNAAAG